MESYIYMACNSACSDSILNLTDLYNTTTVFAENIFSSDVTLQGNDQLNVTLGIL